MNVIKQPCTFCQKQKPTTFSIVKGRMTFMCFDCKLAIIASELKFTDDELIPHEDEAIRFFDNARNEPCYNNSSI